MAEHELSLFDRVGLWVLRHRDGRTVDGIRLVDMRDQDPAFYGTIDRALALIRQYDSRRYKRVTEHIKWIVNHVLPRGGLSYYDSLHICVVEFFEFPDIDSDFVTAAYASFIIHEATHGAICARGIAYKPQHRARIERLCVAEQNRFAARLASADPRRYSLELLRWDFDEAHWEEAWTGGRIKPVLSMLSRSLTNR